MKTIGLVRTKEEFKDMVSKLEDMDECICHGSPKEYPCVVAIKKATIFETYFDFIYREDVKELFNEFEPF